MPFTFTQFFYDFVPVAGMLAVIHILFVSLIYMVSKALSNENLLAFSRHEFAQAIYSAVIIGSVITTIAIVNNLFCIHLSENGLFSGACDSDIGLIAHVKVARAHLGELYNNVRVLAKGALRGFDWTATSSGTTIGIGIISLSPLKYSAIHSFIYGESFTILTDALLFVKLQELFMLIHTAYFFPVMFNLGLVFRMMPFTRKLGGLLMGISLSLFFVLPYMYILSQVVLESAGTLSYKFIVDTANYAFAFLTFGSVMGGDTYNDFDEYMEKAREVNPTGDVFGKAATSLYNDKYKGLTDFSYRMGASQMYASPSSNNAFGKAADYYNPDSPQYHNYSFVEVVARVLVTVTFFSVFSIIGAISASIEISSLFGGDVEIAGLTRII